MVNEVMNETKFEVERDLVGSVDGGPKEHMICLVRPDKTNNVSIVLNGETIGSLLLPQSLFTK